MASASQPRQILSHATRSHMTIYTVSQKRDLWLPIFDWLIDWLIFNITRNKRTCHSRNGKVYTHTVVKTNIKMDKKHYIYLKRQRGTNDFLWISESHLGSAYVMSFGSDVILTYTIRLRWFWQKCYRESKKSDNGFPPHLSSASTKEKTHSRPYVQHSPTAAALSTSFFLNHAPQQPQAELVDHKI